MTGDDITADRGRGDSGDQDHWYTARDGAWAGPFPFGVLVELARVTVLRSDDLVWSRQTEYWVHAAAIPGLFRPPRLRDDTRDNAPEDACTEPRPRTSRTSPRETPVFVPPHEARADPSALGTCLWGGVAWVIAGWALIAVLLLDVPQFRNMLVETRLQVFGTLILIGVAAFLLPRLWRVSECGAKGRRRIAAKSLHLVVGLTVPVSLATSVPLVVHFEDNLLIAAGLDPLGTFEVSRLEDGTGVEVNGSLGAGVTSEVAEMLRDLPDARTIHLNSPGGWIVEGRYLRELIKKQGLATYTSTECSSACVAPFIAGRSRTVHVDAKLGFHAMSGRGADPVYLRMAENAWGKELRAMAASEAFIERALSTATDMWYPSHRQLIENHLIDGELGDR